MVPRPVRSISIAPVTECSPIDPPAALRLWSKLGRTVTVAVPMLEPLRALVAKFERAQGGVGTLLFNSRATSWTPYSLDAAATTSRTGSVSTSTSTTARGPKSRTYAKPV